MNVCQWNDKVANSKTGILKCDMTITKTTKYHRSTVSHQKTRWHRAVQSPTKRQDDTELYSLPPKDKMTQTCTVSHQKTRWHRAVHSPTKRQDDTELYSLPPKDKMTQSCTVSHQKTRWHRAVRSPTKRQDDTELYSLPPKDKMTQSCTVCHQKTRWHRADSYSTRALDQRHAPAALSRGRGPVAVWQEAGIAPGPVWMGMVKTEYIAPIVIRNKNCPGRSKSLYRLCYRRPINFPLPFVHFFWAEAL